MSDRRPEEGGYEGDKTPEEIERDIALTRANLSETLDALEHKLEPRHLLEKGMDMFRESMNGNLGRVGDTLRDHPIPVALIGVGLGWLLLSGTGATRRSTAERYARSVRDTVGGAVDRAGEAASHLAGRMRGMVGAGEQMGREAHAYARTKGHEARHALERGRETARRDFAGYGREPSGESWRSSRDYAAEQTDRLGDYGRRALHAAGDYASYAGEQIGRAGNRVAHVVEDNPLAVAGLGLLAGALIAAALPSTRFEDEWIGESGDDLWREAKEAGREAWERTRDVAGQAAEAAGEAVRDAVSETKDAASREIDEATRSMPEKP